MGHNPKNSAVTEQFVWSRLGRSCVTLCVVGALGAIVAIGVSIAGATVSVHDALDTKCVIDGAEFQSCPGGHCCYTTFISSSTGLVAHRFGCCANNQGCALPPGPDENGDWFPTCHTPDGGGSGCDPCDGLPIDPGGEL